MSEPIHHRLEVGAACQQPRGVGVAQVVYAHVKVDAASLEQDVPRYKPDVFWKRGSSGLRPAMVRIGEGD